MDHKICVFVTHADRVRWIVKPATYNAFIDLCYKEFGIRDENWGNMILVPHIICHSLTRGIFHAEIDPSAYAEIPHNEHIVLYKDSTRATSSSRMVSAPVPRAIRVKAVVTESENSSTIGHDTPDTFEDTGDEISWNDLSTSKEKGKNPASQPKKIATHKPVRRASTLKKPENENIWGYINDDNHSWCVTGELQAKLGVPQSGPIRGCPQCGGPCSDVCAFFGPIFPSSNTQKNEGFKDKNKENELQMWGNPDCSHCGGWGCSKCQAKRPEASSSHAENSKNSEGKKSVAESVASEDGLATDWERDDCGRWDRWEFKSKKPIGKKTYTESLASEDEVSHTPDCSNRGWDSMGECTDYENNNGNASSSNTENKKSKKKESGWASEGTEFTTEGNVNYGWGNHASGWGASFETEAEMSDNETVASSNNSWDATAEDMSVCSDEESMADKSTSDSEAETIRGTAASMPDFEEAVPALKENKKFTVFQVAEKSTATQTPLKIAPHPASYGLKGPRSGRPPAPALDPWYLNHSPSEFFDKFANTRKNPRAAEAEASTTGERGAKVAKTAASIAARGKLRLQAKKLGPSLDEAVRMKLNPRNFLQVQEMGDEGRKRFQKLIQNKGLGLKDLRLSQERDDEKEAASRKEIMRKAVEIMKLRAENAEKAKQGKVVEAREKFQAEDKCIRREEGGNIAMLKASLAELAEYCRKHDEWKRLPSPTPEYSVAFERGIDNWQAFGKMHSNLPKEKSSEDMGW